MNVGDAFGESGSLDLLVSNVDRQLRLLGVNLLSHQIGIGEIEMAPLRSDADWEVRCGYWCYF